MTGEPLDVAVVGAGVVGLAVAREPQPRGAYVAVFERVARVLSDEVVESRSDDALAVLDVHRFAENLAVPEPQLV